MAGHIQIVFKKRVFEGLFHASFFFLLGVLNHFLVGWLVGFTPQHPPPEPPLASPRGAEGSRHHRRPTPPMPFLYRTLPHSRETCLVTVWTISGTLGSFLC